MSLFTISDPHLSLGCNKPMDIFRGWDNYVGRLEENWRRLVSDDDTVVMPGDISWGMSLKESYEDLKFIHSLPGKKIISKGNHDYWWTTMKKMNDFIAVNGFSTISILHNNHYRYERYGICGSRGWIAENGEPDDAKVLAREAARLETSICSAEGEGLEPIVFLHYPPIYAATYNYSILDVLHRHDIKNVYYGHIHGSSQSYAICGERDGIMFRLVSCDYVHFEPVKIL
ncbi:MAG: metallophosphoesterase [Oscillospiraceae bacterium]|nr:metallophosphoesterase [Oscillospiraceae bacterium]MBQ4311761.1 metallophosphoesterase [Oscillospiraceae bacterium]MBQ5417769.1 metallophosphoesterase [Oscillospiraceae bacterium]